MAARDEVNRLAGVTFVEDNLTTTKGARPCRLECRPYLLGRQAGEKLPLDLSVTRYDRTLAGTRDTTSRDRNSAKLRLDVGSSPPSREIGGCLHRTFKATRIFRLRRTASWPQINATFSSGVYAGSTPRSFGVLGRHRRGTDPLEPCGFARPGTSSYGS